MKIFYRVSPYLSSNPNPLGTNKYKIIKRCFKSFKEALGDQEVIILNDSLHPDWKEIFDGFEMVDSPNGNVESFQKQIDLICELPDGEKVMFVDDDYLWVKGSINKIEKALDELVIVSPYDHPGHYREDRFKNDMKKMVLVDNQTYREAPSNTLTFATHAWVIKQNQELIKSFGIRDHEMFMELDHELYVPVPSFATHLVTGVLAPNVDWKI